MRRCRVTEFQRPMDAVDFETQALEALPFDDVLLPECVQALAEAPEVTSSPACRCSPQRYTAVRYQSDRVNKTLLLNETGEG